MTQTFYDQKQVAETYAKEIAGNFEGKQKLVLTDRYLKGKALDVGCANGALFLSESTKITYGIGIDLSQEMINVCNQSLAKTKIKNIKFEKQNATKLPYENEEFDVVVSFSTLLFVDSITKAIAEISRVLTKGGVGILDISGKYNIENIFLTKHYREKGYNNLQLLSFKDIKNLLHKNNLQIIEKKSFGVLTFWKLLPYICNSKKLTKILTPKLDYKISNSFLNLFSRRWYIVVKKYENYIPN